MEKKWEQMTPAEKRNDLDSKWLSPPGAKYQQPRSGKRL